MSIQKPSFDSLPLRKDGPRGNAWGLFGDDDQCGMLNLLTPEVVAEAAREIKEGVRVSTDLRLDRMAVPCFGRLPFEHKIKNKAPRSVNDDTVIFNTQVGSQWDGFRHYGFQKEQVYFGGRTLDDLLNTDAIGTHGECSVPMPVATEPSLLTFSQLGQKRAALLGAAFSSITSRGQRQKASKSKRSQPPQSRYQPSKKSQRVRERC